MNTWSPTPRCTSSSSPSLTTTVIKDIYYPICDELVRIDLLLSEVVTRDIHIGIEKLVAAIRDKDYDTAYYYLKRDHFGTTIGGYSVAQQVEKHLAELRAAQN